MSAPDRIKISKEFHAMGSGLWLSVEMPIAPGENEISEFIKGDTILNNAFAAINPGATIHVNPEYSSHLENRFNVAQPQPVINREKERVEILIDNAKDVAELVKYETYAADHGLSDYYLDKLDHLKNKQ